MVVSVADDVTVARPGDRVAVDLVGLSRACLECWFCRRGQYVQCAARRPGFGGAFAEYLSVPATACFRIDDSMSWVEGALVEPLAVALHAVRRAGLGRSDTAVVLGAGAIGLCVIAAARAVSARPIIATARYSHQADMARAFGADIVVPPENDDAWSLAAQRAHTNGEDHYVPAGGSALLEAVVAATEGRGTDVVFETIGGLSGAALLQAVALCRKQGRIVSIGTPKEPVAVNLPSMQRREQSLILSRCYGVTNGQHDFERAIRCIGSGRARVVKLVTHRFPLEQARAAFQTAGEKSSGVLKVQFVFPV
jgi:L-iditol 2-dehydrogenase